MLPSSPSFSFLFKLFPLLSLLDGLSSFSSKNPVPLSFIAKTPHSLANLFQVSLIFSQATLSGFSPTAKIKIPSSSTSFSPSYIYPPFTTQKNIFLFMQCWYPPTASVVVLSIAPTSSLPSLLPIPSSLPEQLTH